ncbi:ABC transporter permease [Blastochloris viridis]|uniref:Alkanesulfonates transport system permease protein n=1 Tax=Blastochloris viridis TaxID=1079 RepID=A0A0H5BHY1_BLAVI|nr:ABC transporter permease subunit [Blastochloris viridis]ALK09366.1 Bicarbonate transport system permease protein CmpB [Blastochloris viridis]BAS00755.1 alkanesulfonates transport system permease protein [Blastochloris viridis]CUU42029.1 Bicarbonate transport system permease protein CmpB [Blastochloris viridis]
MTSIVDDRSDSAFVLESRETVAPCGIRWTAVLAPPAWLAAAAVTAWWPQPQDWPRTTELVAVALAVAVVVLVTAVFGHRLGKFGRAARRGEAWMIALAVIFTAWELVTAKLAWLPVPFFMPPQAILEVYLDEGAMLAECVAYSALLLVKGVAIGGVAGFVFGLALGWSPVASYWGHPILRFVGPIPATAWLPFAFFAFPSSASAGVFLIALATGVPVAVLTWSGVATVSSAYYDIARTLGANQRFLVLKVAIPAAMPHVFVGLFMGLGGAFAVLVVAEMMGVKAGLGWYLQWAQGWGAYGNMYAALVVLAILCSGAVTLLFRVRDHLLAWQKGLLRW